MYETDQKALYRVYATFALVLLVLAAYACICIHTGRTSTNGLQGSTDREIGTAQEQQRQTGTEIGRATAEIGDAENSIGRVSEAINIGQQRARTVQEGIEECQNLTRECQDLATEGLNILGDIGG